MRKTIAVVFALVCMTYMTACGGGSSSTTATTKYDTLPAPFETYSSVVGGRIPKGPLTFTNYSVSTFSGSSVGFSNHSTSNSPPAKFNRPMAVTSDGTNLYVADYLNNSIRQINIATGFDATIAGNVLGLAGSLDGTGTAATFNAPRDITTDGTNLYVADTGNYTIRKIVISSGVVTTLAGSAGAAGSVDADIGTDARFNIINGITTDGKRLYVTDSNNTIRKITIDPGVAGAVYSGPVTTVAGTPGLTGTAGATDGTQGAARFNLPQHITTDGPNLYVTDFTSSTIRKIVIATGAVTTIAGKFEPGGPGILESDSTDGTGQTARFNQPNGITTDGANLYVTDSYYNTVRKIVLPAPGAVYSGPVTTIAGGASGAAGGLTEGIGAVAKFNFPIGITTDGKSLYIADNQNHRIRKIQ